MLSVEIHFLTGRYVASAYNDRSQAEWPPHPARFYSALVQCWADAGCDAAEAAALDWLAALAAPDIVAGDAGGLAGQPTFYVPINDTTVLGKWISSIADVQKARAALAAVDTEDSKAQKRALKAVEEKNSRLERAWRTAYAVDDKSSKKDLDAAPTLLPERRSKQARSFPSVLPAEPRVRFQWPEAEPEAATLRALDRLCGRLARLGHSSSFICCALDARREEPSLIPLAQGGQVLRVPLARQRALLEQDFLSHKGVEGRILPFRPVRYGVPGDELGAPASLLSGELLVLARKSGSKPRLRDSTSWTGALRAALIRHAAEPVHPIISGHSGPSPLDRPHAAYLPLPFVGWEHADGSVPGLAVLLPRDTDAAARQAVLYALGRWRETGMSLHVGRQGASSFEFRASPDHRRTLQARTWTRRARRWSSVTPLALDENPGRLDARNPEKARVAEQRAEGIVVRACERVGLPPPSQVSIESGAVIRGSEPARVFGPFPKRKAKGRHRRVLVHARLEFAEPVAGPLLLGAGRYFGLGLFRPGVGD